MGIQNHVQNFIVLCTFEIPQKLLLVIGYALTLHYSFPTESNLFLVLANHCVGS